MAPRLFLPLLGLVFGSFAMAGAADFHGVRVTVEPVLGYEYSTRTTPSVHRAGMFIYGARFTLGRPHLAVEGEYTRGTDNEAFTTPSILAVTTQRENVRVGGRASAGIGERFDVFARFGGQATRVKVKTVDLIATNESVKEWDLHPYLGAGVQARFLALFSINLDANMVFNSFKDFSLNPVQVSSSIQFHLN